MKMTEFNYENTQFQPRTDLLFAVIAMLSLALSGCAKQGFSEMKAQNSGQEQREERVLGRILSQPKTFSEQPENPPPQQTPGAGDEAPAPQIPEPTPPPRDEAEDEGDTEIQPSKHSPTPPPTRPQAKPAVKVQKPAMPVSTFNFRGFWDKRAKHGAQWTRFSVAALRTYGRSLFKGTPPADIGGFCPRYKSLGENGRIDFWVKLLSALAAAESSYNPRDSYRENMRDSNGNAVVSRGLLQISIASAQPYGCGFRSEAELHDPQRNLECGVKILNHWVRNDGVLSLNRNSRWLGGARYWSTLRDYNHNFRNIRAILRQSEHCGG